MLIKIDDLIDKRHTGIEICPKGIGIDENLSVWIEDFCCIECFECDYVISKFIATMKGDMGEVLQT